MPRDKPKRSYWDSCVFLAFISREQKDDHGVIVRELLEAARKGEMEIITSVLTITEVAFAEREKLARSTSHAALREIENLWDHPAVRLAGFNRLTAVSARDLIRKAMPLKLSLQAADAIHLSTASRTRCQEILTYDPKWVTYAALVGGIKIGEPAITQPPLAFEKGPA